VRRLGQAEPLVGCVFLALLVASFVVGGSPPGASASTAKVVRFWRDHRDAQITAALLAGFAAVFLVWFGAVVRTTLRDAEDESGRIAAAAFGGFLLIAAGGLAIAGFQFTAADTAGDVPATVTQALAALNRDFFFLLDGGVLIAVFATAAATLRHSALPRWYGYLSIAVGLIFLTPAFAVAFPAFGVWTLLLSLLTFRADSPSIRRSPAPLR
jgi:Flp pilus assembly pilin Flp